MEKLTYSSKTCLKIAGGGMHLLHPPRIRPWPHLIQHAYQAHWYDYCIDTAAFKNQIKSSIYSPYNAEACNELRGPSPRLSAWATQLRRIVATVASRWRRCADLTGPGIELQTSRTDSVRLATELTAGFLQQPYIR